MGTHFFFDWLDSASAVATSTSAPAGALGSRLSISFERPKCTIINAFCGSHDMATWGHMDVDHDSTFRTTKLMN